MGASFLQAVGERDVRGLVEAGHQVIIVTGDRDSYQLVRDPDVKVLYNKRGVSDYALYDEAGIAERTGVTPQLYPQYAALRGDNSDNLPGVPGVGEKTAAKLINAYGGLDGIFEHVDEQTPKLRSNLAEHEARARKNLELMQLRHDAPIDDLVIDDLGVTPNADELKRLTNSDRFDYLAEHRGMFSRLGTTPEKVEKLRADHGIYMVGDSRMNIAGLNANTIPVLAKAIVDAGI